MSKVIVITGGNSGIGAATARLAAERGYAVAVGYRANAGQAGDVVAAIRARNGRASAVQVDVRSEDSVVRCFETVARELGAPNVLVNSAGLACAQARLEAMAAARIEEVLAVNVLGTLLCSREAVRRMSTRHGGEGGVIVNLSSAASRLGSAGEYVDYAASKGAVDSFTLGLAREVAAEGIRVNAVRPGLIDTAFHARAGDAGRAARLASGIPVERAGTAEEVAFAILWLASPEAAFTTGALLDVSGGR
jgi:NAD(P)-dependent dehydrogenase (short-subunit alcohol dehydrogenase family)